MTGKFCLPDVFSTVAMKAGAIMVITVMCFEGK